MKRLGLILLLVAVAAAVNLPTKADPIVGEVVRPVPGFTDHVFISASGDIRAIMGPAGKSIAVSNDANAVAVIYGDPTNDPVNNPMEIKIAYSLDDGATWITYGPFSPELRRIYPGVDGADDFDAQPGQLFFAWQESPYGYNDGDEKVMIEEGTPSSSSPSSPMSLPSAVDVYPWNSSIAVNPEDPYNIIVSGWAYLNGGDLSIFCWISDDGGYSWTDTIRMLDPICADGCTGPVRFGTGNYVFYPYQDCYDIGGGVLIAYPHYIESTDGGYTWSAPATLPVPYSSDTSQFWWHEIDAEIINNEPWTVMTALGDDSMWLFHGTGSPGSWTWDVDNIRQIGSVDQWSGGTLYFCHPSQYPSVAYDDVSGRVAIVYKGNYYIGDNATWSIINGAHVGGVYTDDNGATWTVAYPMSTPNNNDIPWANWSATETAHNIVNNATYNVWIHATTFDISFDGGQTDGQLSKFPPGIEEVASNIVHFKFTVTPNITSDNCQATFTMPAHGSVALKVFDATGRLIDEVYNGTLNRGSQSISVNTAELAAGTYFVVLETEAGNDAKKLVKLH